MKKELKKELSEFLQDRFTQISNSVYISLPVILSTLSLIQDDSRLAKLGLLLFFLAVVFFNSIHILYATKLSGKNLIDSQENKIEIKVPKYPELAKFAKGGLIILGVMVISLFVFPGFQIINPSFQHTETPTLTPTLTSTSTSTSTHTSTPAPTNTITPTLTITPSFTPTLTATSTTNPTVFRGLDQQCFHSTYWTPYYFQGENKVIDDRNCWDLEKWGITPTANGFRLDTTDSAIKQDITRRLHTKIKGNTEIRFTIRIDEFTSNENFDGIFMLGVGNPNTILDLGYFIKYTIAGKDNKIYRAAATSLKNYFDPRSIYSLGQSKNVIIRIIDDQARIIIDGEVIHIKNLKPEEHAVFWIVYSLPLNNGRLVAEISNFQIYDK